MNRRRIFAHAFHVALAGLILAPALARAQGDALALQQ
jgi:hypothetical protein